MQRPSVHIIQKQTYDIAVQHQQQGLQVQQTLQDVNLRYILPALKDKFDELFDADVITMLDTIEIDIGSLRSNTAPEEWTEKIVKALEKSFKESKMHKPDANEPAFVQKDNAQHAVDVFIYFLQTGLLMPGSVFSSLAEVKQQLLHTGYQERQRLLEALMHVSSLKSVAERLAALLPAEQFLLAGLFVTDLQEDQWIELNERIIQSINAMLRDKPAAPVISDTAVRFFLIRDMFCLLLEVAKGSVSFTFPKLQAVVDILLYTLENTAALVLKEKQVFFDEQPAVQINGIAAEEKEKSLFFDDGIFLSNAGVCLIAPYLPAYFATIGLCDDVSFYNVSKQEHAVYLLYYLAAGTIAAGEEDLVLAKLLCGWPLQKPCFNADGISAEEQQQAIELLQSVIEYWPALKSTSPDGLREGFLQRRGKLIEQEDHFLIQVEQNTIDILLDGITWGFRFIKLPWMKKAIQVEWY